MGEVKLTKAQIQALQRAPLRYSMITGDCWGQEPQGYTVKVRNGTFNSLQLRGFIAFDRGASNNSTSIYTITDLGRQALSRHDRSGE